MVQRLLSRREALALAIAASAASTLPGGARASDVIELTWADLLPEGENPLPPQLRGIVKHNFANLARQQPKASGFRSDWNGKQIRMPGFVVPLAYEGTGVTAFILVPFVGACVHVPPPPANQLVLVITEEPFENTGLFQAVAVTGLFKTSVSDTDLAEIGYRLTAEKIEPHGL